MDGLLFSFMLRRMADAIGERGRKRCGLVTDTDVDR